MIFLLSLLILIIKYNASWSFRSFVFGSPNISIPMLLLSIYSLVKTLMTKEFNRSYWFDMFCCWSIYGLYCLLAATY